MTGKVLKRTLSSEGIAARSLPEQSSSDDGKPVVTLPPNAPFFPGAGELQPAVQPAVNGSGCYDEALQVSRDSVTTVRCTPNPGQLFLPLYPAVESCPAGMTSVGTIIFHRTTTPIYHVNLGPTENFAVRGYIYSTDLNGEQLSAAEKTLSAGTYQITFDQLLVELGVSVTVTSRRTVCN